MPLKILQRKFDQLWTITSDMKIMRGINLPTLTKKRLKLPENDRAGFLFVIKCNSFILPGRQLSCLAKPTQSIIR